jgi:pimeloyl-ACP methyl ester carboxylesterase
LASGFWYGEAVLRQSPSLQPLQGQPEFERLIATCRDRQDAESGPPVLKVLTPTNATEPPLLFALHGNQSSAVNTRPFWQPAVAQGWLVGLPQSTQLMWKDAHIWTETQSTKTDVLAHLTALRAQHPFDPQRLVLGGHSMGGDMALWLTLSETIPARGFVLIGAGGPLCDEPTDCLPLLKEHAQAVPHLCGYFIIGDHDSLILPDKLRQLANLLTEAGLQCQVEVVPDATHDPHPGYEAALLRGLDFVGANSFA